MKKELWEAIQKRRREEEIEHCKSYVEDIKNHAEKNVKLPQESTIERLESLISPITKYLDDTDKDLQKILGEVDVTHRQKLEYDTPGWLKAKPFPKTKYHCSHMLANEEIFVTLLGIIKKQDARIAQLEGRLDNKLIKKVNSLLKRNK